MIFIIAITLELKNESISKEAFSLSDSRLSPIDSSVFNGDLDIRFDLGTSYALHLSISRKSIVTALSRITHLIHDKLRCKSFLSATSLKSDSAARDWNFKM